VQHPIVADGLNSRFFFKKINLMNKRSIEASEQGKENMHNIFPIASTITVTNRSILSKRSNETPA
jgi:hypothetical protein